MAERSCFSSLLSLPMLCLLVLCLFLVHSVGSQIVSDKRLCADRECKVIISKARALGRHLGNHPVILTFDANDVITITSKSAGSNPHLWGGEVNGQKGYFDKNFVKEYLVLVENPKYEVDTEGDPFEKLGKPPPALEDIENFVSGRKKDTGQSEEDRQAAGEKLASAPTSARFSSLKFGADGSAEEDEELEDLLAQTDLRGEDDKQAEEELQFEPSESDDQGGFTGTLQNTKQDSDDDDDTEGGEKLNKFLKTRLFTGNKGDEDSGEADSVTQGEKNSLKVIPETSHDSLSDKEKIDIKVNAEQQSSGPGLSEEPESKFHNSEKAKNAEGGGEQIADDKKKNEETDMGKDKDADEHKIEKAGDGGNQGIQQSASNVEDQTAEEDEFDPTEIDESWPGEGDDEAETERKDSAAGEGDERDQDVEVGAAGVDSRLDNSEENSADRIDGEKAAGESGSEKLTGKADSEKTAGKAKAISEKAVDGADVEETSSKTETDQIDSNIETSKKPSRAEVDKAPIIAETGNIPSKINVDETTKSDTRAVQNDKDLNIGKAVADKETSQDSGNKLTSKENEDSSIVEADSSDTLKKAEIDTPRTASLDTKLGTESPKNDEGSKQTTIKFPSGASKDRLSNDDSSSKGKIDTEEKNKVQDKENQTFQSLTTGKSDGGLEDSGVVSSEQIESKVRLDTPSGFDSPASALGENSLDQGKSESVSDKRSQSGDQDSELSPELDELIRDRRFEETATHRVRQPPNDDLKVLQSSGTEPSEFETAAETPKLTMTPTVAVGKEASRSLSSELKMTSSSLGDSTECVTVGKDDVDKEKQVDSTSLITITEGSSTIVMNESGDLISVIVPGTHEVFSSAVVDLKSSSDSLGIKPTATEGLPQATTSRGSEQKEDSDGAYTVVNIPLQKAAEGQPNASRKVEAEDKSDALQADATLTSDIYQSADFNSRKVLSLQQQPKLTLQEEQSQKITQRDRLEPGQVAVDSTPSLESILASSQSVNGPSHGETSEALTDEGPESTSEGTAHNNREKAAASEPEGTTQNTADSLDVPPPPSEQEFQSTSVLDDQLPAKDYEPDSVFHSRKIPDEDFLADEEAKSSEPKEGIFKRAFLFVDTYAKSLVDTLPPSVQSVLEAYGLSSGMKIVVATFGLALLVVVVVVSCCSPGDDKKNRHREFVVKFDMLDKQRLIDLKEKENLEDELASSQTKNVELKKQMNQVKEEANKNKSELTTVHLHNESLKKQLDVLREEVDKLKERANSKQGEAKEQNKKTKDLEKQIKKLEEREASLEQTVQKLTSDLKHKEEDMTLLTSKVASLSDQVGHLQIRKDQLLSEAEDWKEKVSDLKERLEQREEEFRQMQETIMFKENELEVLKDCFLQLKSFQESEESEDPEEAGVKIQEKLASMMDVSKMNASLRTLQEERDSLANKLQIELEARKEVEEQLESSRRSMESSMADKMKAERQCQEAQTKLNVLSSYFKEKEMQLQRELGEQEALKKQNQNKLVSADENSKTLQQEVEIVRTQNESLKRELASSERDFRSQIAANEKKAHENWLAARAAERELKEIRHEAGVLRMKLADLERRPFMGPGGIIRPLPTRGLPPSGVMNGALPPGMDRSPSRSSMPPIPPPPHLRDEDFRGPLPPPPFPLDPRRGLPPGMLPPPLDGRSPPPRFPPYGGGRSPPLGMMDGRSPPPFDRRVPQPHHHLDRRSPPLHFPPHDMLPPMPIRGGPHPPPHMSRGSPPTGPDPTRSDGRYPPPHPYGRNPPPASDRQSGKPSNLTSSYQQQSQV